MTSCKRCSFKQRKYSDSVNIRNTRRYGYLAMDSIFKVNISEVSIKFDQIYFFFSFEFLDFSEKVHFPAELFFILYGGGELINISWSLILAQRKKKIAETTQNKTKKLNKTKQKISKSSNQNHTGKNNKAKTMNYKLRVSTCHGKLNPALEKVGQNLLLLLNQI